MIFLGPKIKFQTVVDISGWCPYGKSAGLREYIPSCELYPESWKTNVEALT